LKIRVQKGHEKMIHYTERDTGCAFDGFQEKFMCDIKYEP